MCLNHYIVSSSKPQPALFCTYHIAHLSARYILLVVPSDLSSEILETDKTRLKSPLCYLLALYFVVSYSTFLRIHFSFNKLGIIIVFFYLIGLLLSKVMMTDKGMCRMS